MCVFLDFFRGFELMCEFYPIERMQRIWARDTYPVGSSPGRRERQDDLWKTICEGKKPNSHRRKCRCFLLKIVF